MIELIYCAAGNRRFAQIAIDAGYTYGAQLPNTVYHPIEFADQDWKKPDRERYMAALAEHRPRMATVLDWEHDEQLPDVLEWAEEAAQYVETVIIIPKVFNGIARLPRTIGGATVRLGYSVPTKFGGTQVPLWEFAGWPVHLLGGNPGRQMKLARYLNVASADGNAAQGMAARHCRFWLPGKKPFRNWWPTIEEMDGQKWGDDAIYEAFRRSCHNIMAVWREQVPVAC